MAQSQRLREMLKKLRGRSRRAATTHRVDTIVKIDMEPRLRGSPEQFTALLSHMESHGDLARPQPGPLGTLKSARLWQKLAKTLNSIRGGVYKSPDKWKKVWIDWKSNTKKKAHMMRITANGPYTRGCLSTLERRLLTLIKKEEEQVDNQARSAAPPSIDEKVEIGNMLLAPSSGSPSPEPGEDTQAFPVPSTSQYSPAEQEERPLTPQSEHSEHSERSERSELSERSERSARTERSVGTARSERAERRRQRARQRRREAPMTSTRPVKVVGESMTVGLQRLRMEERRERNEARRLNIEYERNNILRRLADIAQSFLNHYVSQNDHATSLLFSDL